MTDTEVCEPGTAAADDEPDDSDAVERAGDDATAAEGEASASEGERRRWPRLGRVADGWRADRRFFSWLAAIAAGGLVLRIAVILSRPPCPPGLFDQSGCFAGTNDARFYHDQANLFADNVWFHASNTFTVPELIGGTHPSAYHPPLYSLYLAVVSFLGGTSIDAHRVASSVLGVVTVVLIGLLARKLAGNRAGWIAAGMAALYPALWINDTVLMSESMFALLVTVVAMVAYRFWEVPTRRRAFALGAVIALATLTRGEALLLLPLIALPLALGVRDESREGRIRLLVTSVAAFLLLIGPWVAFNLSRFDEPTLLTTSAGSFLHLGNCDDTYYQSEDLGYSAPCDPVAATPALELVDESEKDAILRDRAVDYITDNVGRLPVVAAARVGRTFGFWNPGGQVEAEWRDENRGRAASVAALLAYYAALPFAVGGAVVLWRRRVALSPLLGLVALSALAVMGVHALTRIRTAADVALIVLAAVGLEIVIRTVLRSRREPAADP